jgi:CO dehydrogenase maturation factor
MKLAISGKGGVGKTTLAALLAQVYADAGRQVLVADADPSPCIAGALGFPDELRSQLHPIVEMDALIEERTGAKPGTIGGFFTLNPRVDDIPERFSVVHKGVRLLEMGSVDMGGSGCICPEAAMLKTLFTHLLFRKDDILILDMYAGVEHLGRATVDFVDAMLIVVEPTRRSLGTASQIKKLANDIFHLLLLFQEKDLLELNTLRAVVGIRWHNIFHISPPAAANSCLRDSIPLFLAFKFDIRKQLVGLRI